MVEEKVVETLRFVMMQKILAPPLVGVGEQGREDQCHQRERERGMARLQYTRFERR